MPKVLLITNRFAVGGPSTQAAYLAKYLQPDFETKLVGGPKNHNEHGLDDLLEELSIEPVILPELKRSFGIFNDLKTYKRIKKIIRDFKPDIVHTHTSKPGLYGRWAASRLKVPVIIHTFHGHLFHSYFTWMGSGMHILMERMLAKRTSKIIALSKSQKDEIVIKYKITNKDKVEILPLGIPLDEFNNSLDKKRKIFRKQYQIKDDEIAVGIIARLVHVKNIPLFLKAVKYLKDHTNKKVRAFIIGDGPDKFWIKEKASEMNIDFVEYAYESQKSFLTFTSWKKAADAIAGLDIVVQTSLNEGTPVSLIEAQAVGKAILSTDVGGVKDIVIPGKTAILVDLHNKQDLFDQLLNLVENNDLRSEMAKHGNHFVNEHFSLERMINDTKKLYQSLLD